MVVVMVQSASLGKALRRGWSAVQPVLLKSDATGINFSAINIDDEFLFAEHSWNMTWTTSLSPTNASLPLCSSLSLHPSVLPSMSLPRNLLYSFLVVVCQVTGSWMLHSGRYTASQDQGDGSLRCWELPDTGYTALSNWTKTTCTSNRMRLVVIGRLNLSHSSSGTPLLSRWTAA